MINIHAIFIRLALPYTLLKSSPAHPFYLCSFMQKQLLVNTSLYSPLCKHEIVKIQARSSSPFATFVRGTMYPLLNIPCLNTRDNGKKNSSKFYPFGKVLHIRICFSLSVQYSVIPASTEQIMGVELVAQVSFDVHQA